MSKKVLIETYGCTLNQADSEIMCSILKTEGYGVEQGKYDRKNKQDYVIVNTCTVKAPTEQKICERLKRMKNLGNRLVVAGCMASANEKVIKGIVPNASIVTTANVTRIAAALKQMELGEQAQYSKYSATDKAAYIDTGSSVIAKIPISEGCLSNCTFCETKLARGPLNSFSEKAIVKAVSTSLENGAKEIDLTAQDTGAYGLDKKTNIAELVNKISELEGKFKIRVGMMNPEHLQRYFDELLEAYQNPKVYKFIHLPVQSGSDKVLGEMNRKYGMDVFEAYVKELRKKVTGISLETDIIVGYPTETEQTFEASLEFVKKVRPTITNVSRFSARPHTKAALLKQLCSEKIKGRSVAMSAEVKKVQEQDRKKEVGTEQKVLITENNSRSFAGRNDAYLAVAVQGRGLRLGVTANVRITGSNFAYLTGEFQGKKASK